MIAGFSMAGGTEGFVAIAVVVTGAGAGAGAGAQVAESLGGAILADFVDYHPSPLLCAFLCFCKWGNAVPMTIFLRLVWALLWHRGLLQFWAVLQFGGGQMWELE